MSGMQIAAVVMERPYGIMEFCDAVKGYARQKGIRESKWGILSRRCNWNDRSDLNKMVSRTYNTASKLKRDMRNTKSSRTR